VFLRSSAVFRSPWDRDHAIARASEPLDVIQFVIGALARDEIGVQRTLRRRKRLQRLAKAAEV
jgi:hypothetical protein